MWIIAQPLHLWSEMISRRVRVGHFAAKDVELLEVKFFDAPAVRIGEAVPAPLGENGKGNGIGERGGECLQSGGIGRKGEVAVAEGERVPRVERVQLRVVPRNKSVAINLRRSQAGRCRHPTPGQGDDSPSYKNRTPREHGVIGTYRSARRKRPIRIDVAGDAAYLLPECWFEWDILIECKLPAQANMEC